MTIATQEEFSRVYRASYAPVLAYLRRRAELETSEDLAAEVFLRAWRRKDTCAGEPLPWLYGIARNVLLEHYRHRDQHGSTVAQLTTAAEHDLQLAQTAQESATESSIAMALSIQQALAELTEADREILLLYTWENLGYEEIAVALDVSAATARVRMHRARKRLAEIVEKESDV